MVYVRAFTLRTTSQQIILTLALFKVMALLRNTAIRIYLISTFTLASMATNSYGQVSDTTKQAAAIDTATVAKTDSSFRNRPTTAAAIKDTAVKPKLPFQPKPKKAGLYSAIIPGAGQIYNRQYWKAPIVYAGVVAAAYFFQSNLEQYRHYRKEYLYRLSNPNAPIPAEEPYTTADLKVRQDQYRKLLDMTGLFSALGYTLQVMDAVAAAHLKNFDISRDISMNFRPVIMPSYIGVGIVMDIK